MNETAKDIAQLLARDVEAICLKLLPNGKKIGHEWRVGSVDGEPGKSLGVHLDGAKAGVWCDFNSGQGGDLLDLWAEVNKIDLGQAIREAKEYLGIRETRFQPDQGRKTYKRPEKSKALRSIKPQSPVMNYLTKERKLTEETLRVFKVVEHPNTFTEYPENPANYVFPYIRDGEIINFKHVGLLRPNDKKLVSQAGGAEPCLFGWNVLDPKSRKVAITEGELDTLTLHQYGIAALSVPNGGGKGGKQNWLENDYERMARFDEIFLCMDTDGPGMEAALDLAERLGYYRCRLVELPYKDANKCLQHGMTVDELLVFFRNSRFINPKELRDASSYTDDVIRLFYPPEDKPVGMKTPWPKIGTNLMFRPSELTVWSGFSSHGKSLVLNQVILHGLAANERACIGSFEMPAAVTLQRMVRQMTTLAKPEKPHIQDAMGWLSQKLWLFDMMGQVRIDRVLEVFTYVRQRFGASQFVLDSMTMLGVADDDYKGQKAVAEKLVEFVNTHQCHVHLVVHPRKGDEYSLPGKMDVKGTGAITDLAHNVIMFWKDKKKSEIKELLETEQRHPTMEEERKLTDPDAIARVDKQRMTGWESQIMLWYHPASMQCLGSSTEPPTIYVPYSPEAF